MRYLLNGGQGWLRPERHTATRTQSTALTAGEAISEADRSLCYIRTFVPTYLPPSRFTRNQSNQPINYIYFETCPQSDLNFLKLSRNSFSPFFIRMACGHCRRPLLGVVTVPSCQTSYAFRLSLLPLTCSSLAFSMPLPKRRMKIMPNSCPKM